MIMEEIKIDGLNEGLIDLNNASFREIVERSREKALIGMPWNKNVYDYLFESGISGDEINAILNMASFGLYIIDEEGVEEEV